MAKTKNNDLTLGLSGRVGTMICFRQIDGETEAFRHPKKRKGPGTANQQSHRKRFLEAIWYAKISDQ